MKTLYLDCSMGVAGDMLCGALLELVNNKDSILNTINTIGFDNVHIEAISDTKCGIKGTHIKVTIHGHEEHEHHHHDHEHHHEHHHSSYKDICDIINKLNVSNIVKEDAKQVYLLIANAESIAHGTTVDNIHFHEVGTIDAVCDVVLCCMLFDAIGADNIIASPICTGYGQVHCAHGVLSVPAPATSLLLENIPIYAGDIESELCTPTGAALIKHFASSFSQMPQMNVSKLGFGTGTKNFDKANVVRSYLGETNSLKDEIVKFECNIDDMTAEQIGLACQTLLDNGARDVFTTPIMMKKYRQGTLISVICDKEKEQDFVELIFKHTTTIGIRKSICERYILSRDCKEIKTKYGVVHIKQSQGYGTTKTKYECDDIARIAKDNNMSYDQVIEEIEKGLN